MTTKAPKTVEEHVSTALKFLQDSNRENRPKIVDECTFPVTGRGCVSMIITDLAVIRCTGQGLELLEVAPGWTAEEVQELTAAPLKLSPDLAEYQL